MAKKTGKKKGKKMARTKARRGRARTELQLINLKATRADRKSLTANAQKYMDGNLSAWLRHAGLNYKPGTRKLSA